jgi:hypothetical protein
MHVALSGIAAVRDRRRIIVEEVKRVKGVRWRSAMWEGREEDGTGGLWTLPLGAHEEQRTTMQGVLGIAPRRGGVGDPGVPIYRLRWRAKRAHGYGAIEGVVNRAGWLDSGVEDKGEGEGVVLHGRRSSAWSTGNK